MGMLVGFALAAVVGLAAAGMALDRSRLVSGEVTIAATDARVYELVSNLESGWSKWSPLVPQGEGMSMKYGPQTSGNGARVEWTGRAGTGALELTDCAPGERVSYRTTLSLGGMSALGKITLERKPSGVLVSWRDELSVGSNPVWRWLALAMDGLRKRNIRQGLDALKCVAEQPA